MDKTDHSSFKTLYTDYFRQSFLFVKSYVFDNMIAEDIASECIIRAWQGAQKETIRNMKAYLYTLLKNATLNYLNHEKIKLRSFDRLKEQQNSELSLRINTLESCFLQEILTGEILEIVEQTLKTTSPQSREIFLLSRFKGVSHKEIASLWNISVKDVEYHITKVLKLLKLELHDYLVAFAAFSFFFF